MQSENEYIIEEGTVSFESDDIAENDEIISVRIPASLKYLADGVLSNAGSWTMGRRGLEEITVDPANEVFFIQENFLYAKEASGCRLILYFGNDENITIPSFVNSIAAGAFKGAKIFSVRFEKTGNTVYFPIEHAFHLSKLLENFGKNGKLFDFTDYDKYLLQSRYNRVERLDNPLYRVRFSRIKVKMICSRLQEPIDLPEEVKAEMISYIAENICAVVKDISEESGALEELKLLADTGFFNEDNIDPVIDMLNSTSARDMLHFAMAYKNAHFAAKEYDFDI